MEAIGLNPIRLDAIGIDPIRLNAIRLGVPGASSGSARPYIDPEVLASLVGVWICDGKTNYDPDRNIIKNKLPGRGGDFEILNAAYKLNSGFGKYEEDFTTWSNPNENIKITDSKVTVTSIDDFNPTNWIIWKIDRSINSFKVKITGLPTNGMLCYNYNKEVGSSNFVCFPIYKDGIYELPYGHGNSRGNGFKADVTNTPLKNYIGLTIEQIPSFEGSFVTDGVDDMIVSQKTVSEMLGGGNKCTVISLITHISGAGKYNVIGNSRIQFSDYAGQSFMAGCSSKFGEKIVELGDKEKTQVFQYTTFDSKLSIGSLKDGLEMSSYAYYSTFIFNKDSVPIDWIHQVIAYFNLDKHVEPTVYYDVPKQGLTNETPLSDWYLKDFSKNGFDMTLFNFGKAANSGIGLYMYNWTTWHAEPNIVIKHKSYVELAKDLNVNNGCWAAYNDGDKKFTKSFKIKIKGLVRGWIEYGTKVNENDKYVNTYIYENGEYVIPECYLSGLLFNGANAGTIIEQIPDYEGALCFDGVNDYGKVTGLPVLKDYTVVADYCNLSDNNAFLLSKNAGNNGAFVYNNVGTTHSFGQVNNINPKDTERKIHYQSKYINDKINISAGGFIDTDTLWLCTVRDNDSRFKSVALYSTMLFHYSLSEFLLERQLKKYKLGTLYPNMVEFRPIVKSNVEFEDIIFRIGKPTWQVPIVGSYYESQTLYIEVKPKGCDEISSIKLNGVEVIENIKQNNGYIRFYAELSKSPQKIDITIDEYIRYEDIVHPYPAIVSLRQDGKDITWGDKLKVGSEVTFVNHVNLLPERYAVSGGISYNGTMLPSWNSPIKVEKSMVFTSVHGWKLNTPEPHAIYSPQKLNIPNSSLKILGYVPDLTGKGNHGKLNNFAYTEDSGVTTDGSIKLDGVDDFITIPTLAHGGKCVMMKVNWSNYEMVYAQNKVGAENKFAIFCRDVVYYTQNDGATYIDGILNKYLMAVDLINITHNITVTNNVNIEITQSPIIGSNHIHNDNYSKMSMYEFMLFPEIPSEDEIKKLNDVMGIEGNVFPYIAKFKNSTLISNETLIKNE